MDHKKAENILELKNNYTKDDIKRNYQISFEISSR